MYVPTMSPGKEVLLDISVVGQRSEGRTRRKATPMTKPTTTHKRRDKDSDRNPVCCRVGIRIRETSRQCQQRETGIERVSQMMPQDAVCISRPSSLKRPSRPLLPPT